MPNKKLIYIAISLILIVFFISRSGSNAKISPLTSNSKIIAFGDSLTYGTGADRSESYPAQLSQLIGTEVVNLGIPGEVTATGLQRLPGILEEHTPDLVILCHGGNDILRSKSKNRLRNNLERMITLIKDSGSDVILIAVPEKGLLLSPPELYKELADEYKIPIDTDLISDLMTKRSLKSDHVHPNAKGYKKMAETIYELIQDSQ